MKKVYGFVWHVVSREQLASEGMGGVRCDAFETESADELAAEIIMNVFLQKVIGGCRVVGCEHTPIVTDELTPKMIMSGMTAHMKKVTTPDDKRELVLRVMSALASLSDEKLVRVLQSFPKKARAFLNDPASLRNPTKREIESFALGGNFSREYPRLKRSLARHSSSLKLVQR